MLLQKYDKKRYHAKTYLKKDYTVFTPLYCHQSFDL